MGEKVSTTYLKLRAAGLGCRAAARAAGYASRPPSAVTKQAALIPQLKRERGLCATYDEQLDAINKRIEDLKIERDRVCALMELCIILDPS